MELKRILAKDARSANEKAIAQYGKHVLVISCSQVDGQTELIVAIDVAADAANKPQPRAVQLHDTDSASALSAKEFMPFRAALEAVRAVVPEAHAPQAITQNPAESSLKPNKARAEANPGPQPARDSMAWYMDEPVSESTSEEIAPVLQAAKRVAAKEIAAEQAQAEHVDAMRSREIVDLVRQEINALRTEFKLSRQVNTWQNTAELPAALGPLFEALQDSGMPATLRALVVDSVRDCEDIDSALQAMRTLLISALPAHATAAPERGVHALCGGSGAGKTLMAARLAHAASEHLATEDIALVSYNDHRAGAWSQMQMLAAQVGVECFRARDLDTLQLLLEELRSRSLVLIDTAGADFLRHASDLARLSDALLDADQRLIQLHAVTAADSSVASLRRLVNTDGWRWHSLLLSKCDESTAPWPLIQTLCEQTLIPSATAQSNQVRSTTLPYSAENLVALGIAQLQDNLQAHAAPTNAPHHITALVAAAHTKDAAPGKKEPLPLLRSSFFRRG